MNFEVLSVQSTCLCAKIYGKMFELENACKVALNPGIFVM
jgi:hypothetical protein